MSDFIAKVRALLAAVPTWGAIGTGILTAIGTEVVPLLPEDVGVRVAALIALALAGVAAIVRVVSSVTPVPSGATGLLMPPGLSLNVELRDRYGDGIQGTTVTR